MKTLLYRYCEIETLKMIILENAKIEKIRIFGRKTDIQILLKSNLIYFDK